MTDFALGLNPVIQWAGDEYESAARALSAYLSSRMGCTVRLETEPSYPAQIAAMGDGSLDAASFGPYAFYRAREVAGAVALVVRADESSTSPGTYQSVIAVRADSPLHLLSDVRGMSVGFVDANSTSGYLIPRQMLQACGVNPDLEIESCFFQTHQAVLEAVLSGEVAAGAMHSSIFAARSTPEQPDSLQVRSLAISAPVPAGPVAVRRGLNWDMRQRLLQALLRLHETDAASYLLLPTGSRFLPASGRSVTLKTVAALAGTSYGTVSRVINNEGRVASETHERVMRIVKELGYRPNASAVHLVANRSDLVGILVADMTDPVLNGSLTRAQQILAEHGVQVVLCVANGSRELEAEYLGLLESGRFGGMLLTNWSAKTRAVGILAAAGHAIVILGVPAGSAPIHSVDLHHETALRCAYQALHDLGHRHIGAMVSEAMVHGAQRALQAAHVDIIGVQDPADRDAVCPEVHELLARPGCPTALLCGSERLAVIVLKAAYDLGIPVPSAVSVIALGDTWLMRSTIPDLSSVSLPLEAVGEHAALLLWAQLSGEATPSTLQLPAPVLTLRGSTTQLEVLPC